LKRPDEWLEHGDELGPGGRSAGQIVVVDPVDHTRFAAVRQPLPLGERRHHQELILAQPKMLGKRTAVEHRSTED
jgi:hypothetical protein